MKVYVKNAVGTSDLELPLFVSSWIEYWEERSGNNLKDLNCRCPACGHSIDETKFVGCHVNKKSDNSENMYIIPLCRHCNTRIDYFEVDHNLLEIAPKRINRDSIRF